MISTSCQYRLLTGGFNAKRMKTMKLKTSLLVLALLFLQCSSDSDDVDMITQNQQTTVNPPTSTETTTSAEPTQQTFDRAGMLTFWADQIILPAYGNFVTELNEFNNSISAFTQDPSATSLESLRQQWLEAYGAWQYIEMFDIGPAEELYFKNRMNIYPANVDRIEQNISNNEYDLDVSANFTSQGFSTLDYLLFGIADTDDELQQKLADQAQNYNTYMVNVTQKMIDLTTSIHTEWQGEYRTAFVASTDNTATSSINKIINDFVFYFEKGFRANKFGIPAGVFSGGPLPDRIEAYHGQTYSKLLSLEAHTAIQQFFNGIAFTDNSVTGLSLKAYLDFIESDISDKLSGRINAQLQAAKDKINELNINFKTQINQNNTEMLLTYDAIQASVVLLKVDMLQKLNISVDYADADGD